MELLTQESEWGLDNYGRKSVKTVYLLRHKIKCGYCGMPICSETGSTRKGDILHYYKCSGKKRFHSDCIKSNIRKDFLAFDRIKEI